MRIARYTTGEDPSYGIVEGEPGREFIAQVQGDPLYQPVVLTGETVRLEDARLLAPVIPRSKVIGIGRNYADHAKEMGGEPPAQPLMFLVPNTAVVGPGDSIVMPAGAQEISYEGELAVVIGRIAKDVPRERVSEVVYGYTCANDVTARDWQRGDGQWARAKGFDTSTPLGPWITTELDVSDVRVTTELNGEPKQDGRTSQFIFDIPEVLAYITSFTTLLPGDVVLTGTPAGVGPMRPGDEVAVSIEGIGTLTNKVIVRD